MDTRLGAAGAFRGELEVDQVGGARVVHALVVLQERGVLGALEGEQAAAEGLGQVHAGGVGGGRVLGGAEVADWLVARATVGLCAMQSGVIERALELTAEYAKSRVAFGRPIGSFQAVTQRLADAFVDVEAVRLTMWQAAWRLASGLPAAAEVAVCVVHPWRHEAALQIDDTRRGTDEPLGIGSDRDDTIVADRDRARDVPPGDKYLPVAQHERRVRRRSAWSRSARHRRCARCDLRDPHAAQCTRIRYIAARCTSAIPFTARSRSPPTNERWSTARSISGSAT